MQVLAATLVALVVAVAASQLVAVQERARALNSQLLAVQTIGQVRADMLTVRADVLRLALDGPSRMEAVTKAMSEHTDALQASWLAYEATGPSSPSSQRTQLWRRCRPGASYADS